MPSKPPGRRRPRVAGTRPTARHDQPGTDEGSRPEEPESTAASELPDPAGAHEGAEETERSGQAAGVEPAGESPAQEASGHAERTEEPEGPPELPEEIAGAARIERGEPDPDAVTGEPSSAAERAGHETAGPEGERSVTSEAERSGSSSAGAAASPGGETDGETDAGAEKGAKRGYPWRVAAVLVIVALLLGGFSAFAATRWGHASESTGNHALTDADATKQVSTQVSNALNTLLAFDYKNPDKNDKAAKNLIDGKLADCSGASNKVGYDKLMGLLKKKGPQAKLRLKSTVLKSGVQQLRGDEAQVLVLLNQDYSKGDGKGAQHSSALAAATVNAIHKDDTWQLQRLCLQ